MQNSDITISLQEYRELIEKSVLLSIIENNFNDVNDWQFAEKVKSILGMKEEGDEQVRKNEKML